MSIQRTAILLIAATSLFAGITVYGEEKPVPVKTAAKPVDAKTDSYSGASCTAPRDDYFINEVWPMVGATKCLQCHKAGGDAEDSDFILLDPAWFSVPELEKTHRHNREQFAAMARWKQQDQSRILLKVVGKLKHGGKDILKPDSAGYTTLATWVQRLDRPSQAALAQRMGDEKNAKPFFEG